MPLIRCIEGHIFDNAAHQVCPTCGAAVTIVKPEPRPDPQPKPLPKPKPIIAEAVRDNGDPDPDPKPKRPIWLYAAAGGSLLIIAVILFFILKPATPPSVPRLSDNNTAQTQPPPPQPAPSPSPAPAPTPAPTPAPAPAPAPPSPLGEVTGPAMFTGSTDTLDIAGNQIKLIGIIGNPGQIQAASNFLHYATNGTFAVRCVLQTGGDYDCRTVTTNVRVSAGLVANGFATADPNGPAEYQQWQADAQAHHRGLWATP
jgi:endonuclease YncB( thermonuclease family)